MILYLAPILAVLLGFLFVVIFKPKKTKNLKLILAFSGAFLLSITVFEFLPEIFKHDSRKVGIFILVGILLQICLEFFSQGAEHGHIHVDKTKKSFPWVLLISLSIHSLFEGAPLHDHDNILWGVVVHKVPIAIILTSFFFNSAIRRIKIYMFLTLFALMTPLGSYLVTVLPVTKEFTPYISAITVGIFLHISTTILFESSEGHKFNAVKLVVIILGLASAYFV